jgi:hypothetical protein
MSEYPTGRVYFSLFYLGIQYADVKQSTEYIYQILMHSLKSYLELI